MKNRIKKLIKVLLVLAALLIVTVTGLNLLVCLSVKDLMYDVEDITYEEGCDCIIVLGCGVWGEEPSPLLSDRLDAAVSLYHSGIAPKILMSGDHGQEGYDEVNVMRRYAIERGVPSEDIFMDHAGFSTYETMSRAESVFGVRRAVIVTQRYHLYRALYDAVCSGIECRGVIATGHTFASMPYWQAREALARVKDVIWCILRPDPTYTGDAIDISGNGEVTLG